MMKGIDVSFWQGEIDWGKVRDSGVQFAVLRGGYGQHTSQKDAYFERNYAGAKEAGLPVGVYWYSYATSVDGAKLEAGACLSCLGGKELELPVFFDQEYEPGILALRNGTRTEICGTFCEAVRAAGYRPGIYSSKDFIENKLNAADLAAYPLWVAQYARECTCRAPYIMWQFTDSGAVPGIRGKVDMNYLYAAPGGGQDEEEIDMSREELKQLVEEAIEEDRKKRTYKTLADVPGYYREAVEKLVEDGTLRGTGKGDLDISEDLARVLTLLHRRGVI